MRFLIFKKFLLCVFIFSFQINKASDIRPRRENPCTRICNAIQDFIAFHIIGVPNVPAPVHFGGEAGVAFASNSGLRLPDASGLRHRVPHVPRDEHELDVEEGHGGPVFNFFTWEFVYPVSARPRGDSPRHLR